MEIPKGLEWITQTPWYPEYKDNIVPLLDKLSKEFIESINLLRANLNAQGVYNAQSDSMERLSEHKSDSKQG